MTHGSFLQPSRKGNANHELCLFANAGKGVK